MRPEVDSIRAAHNLLFHSGLSLSRIKDTIVAGRLFPRSDDHTGVTGRSLAWKIFLTPNEPLQQSAHSLPAPLLSSLRASRKRYTSSLLEKMRAPDGSYADGLVIPGASTSLQRSGSSSENLETNNPLSLHNENPWTEWFTSVELRKTIQQDVERTFPEIVYYRDPIVQAQLTNILFLFSITNVAIGYRQGMHEILAPLYFAVDWDSINSDLSLPSEDAELQEVCSRTWVAADAWALFVAVMLGVGQWYEWRDTPALSTPTTSPPLLGHVQLNVPKNHLDTEPYVTPIVKACNRIQSKLLKSVDPLLWKSMHSAGIEPQIYGIRWLRLLFTREFALGDAMILWDALFACDPTLELALWVCVAMLVRIRNKLIPSDYSTQLTFLLRYPAPPSHEEHEIHHATLLIRQALNLQMAPTPATGASLMMDNRNSLGIPIEVPDPPPSPPRRQSGSTKGERAASDTRPGISGISRPPQNRHVSHQSLGLPEMIAKGLIDRGESLGINKTLMSAVSELKNLPELAASLVRPPASSSVFPLAEERTYEERAWRDSRIRPELERDASALRATHKKLGDSVGWIVDTLLQDEEGVTDPDRLQRIKQRKREALECLAYVRDVLNGAVTQVEDDRLIGEEESMRRRSLAIQKESARFSASSGDSKMQIEPPPAAASVASSASGTGVRTRDVGSSSSQNPFTRLPEGHMVSRSTVSIAPRPKAGASLPQLAPGLARSPPGSSVLSSPPNSFASRPASNFGALSTQMSTALPRRPPPTSSATRGQSPGREALTSNGTKRRSVQDPLGVLS